MNEWLKNASANFVGSFLAAILALIIGKTWIHDATGPKITQTLLEPAKSIMESVHRVSGDNIGVFWRNPDEKQLKAVKPIGVALTLSNSPNITSNIAGGDTHYVRSAENVLSAKEAK